MNSYNYILLIQYHLKHTLVLEGILALSTVNVESKRFYAARRK